MTSVIDLTGTDDCSNTRRGGIIGEFVNGAVRLTQSSADKYDSNKISFEEVFRERDGMRKCLLTAYAIEEEWLFAKLRGVPEAILCIDNGQHSLNVARYKLENITVVHPSFPKFPSYGVMHVKLLLLFHDHYLRVVVSSGNLRSQDYDQLQNILFIQDLPRIASPEDRVTIDSNNSNFLNNLLRLLQALGITGGDLLSKTELFQFDWSLVKAKMVFSIPGMQAVGHQSATGLVMLQRCLEKLPSAITLECQGSSLGALDAEWLKDVTSCASGRLPGPTAKKTPVKKAKKLTETINKESVKSECGAVKVVFPTMDYVIKREGPDVFGTIFCRLENWGKSVYPRDIFHRCESRFGIGQSLHTKIIAASGEGGEELWWYIGSSNFTPSAWGKFVKEKSAIMVANYELGIILTGEDVKTLCPRASFPYPYLRPPTPYDKDDAPWMQDAL